MPVRTLGAASLGGVRLSSLHAAGWFDEHVAGAVAARRRAARRPRRPVVQHLVLTPR